jgi:hypothetical protein
LPTPGRTNQNHVLLSLNKAQTGQFVDLTPFDTGGKLVIEIVQCLDRREPCQTGQHALLAHLSASRLCSQQPFQEITVGRFFLSRFLTGHCVTLGNER